MGIGALIGMGAGTGGAGGSGKTVIPIQFFTSANPSATMANGARYIALADGASESIEWQFRAPKTESLVAFIGYQMSAANAGGVRWRIDLHIASLAEASETALVAGTAFTVAPGNDVVRHELNAASDASVTVAVTLGDLVIMKLTRIGADGADTHTGEARITDVTMVGAA